MTEMGSAQDRPASSTLPPRPTVRQELEGWRLFWAFLEASPDAEGASRRLLDGLTQDVQTLLAGRPLAQHPAAAALRRLFRQAGCDPTRYRPSSEALARRLLKGEALPSIHPLVDLNNALSVRLLVPSCVLAEGTFTSPLVLRAGHDGETFESLRGPFKLDGKPVLADGAGPFGTPITDSQRVKVQPSTRRAWLVAYLPSADIDHDEASRCLDDLVAQSSGAFRRLV